MKLRLKKAVNFLRELLKPYKQYEQMVMTLLYLNFFYEFMLTFDTLIYM